MSAPNPAVVALLADAVLVTLGSASPGCTSNEVVSAAFTVVDRLLRVCLETPNINVDVLRTMIAEMYALLPAETAH